MQTAVMEFSPIFEESSDSDSEDISNYCPILELLRVAHK